MLLAGEMIRSGPIPPVTLLSILAQIGVYLGFVPGLSGSQTKNMCLNPSRILAKGEWWRLLAPVIMHADDMHLYYNMASLLYKGRKLESRLGSPRFAVILSIFTIASTLMTVALSYTIDEVLKAEDYMYQCAVGFSAFCFIPRINPGCLYRLIIDLLLCLAYISMCGSAGCQSHGSRFSDFANFAFYGICLRISVRQLSFFVPRKPPAEWVPLVVMIALLAMVAAFVLCLLFSFARLREEYVACSSKDANPYATLLQEDRDKLDGLSQLLMSSFDSARIRKNLRWLSKSSHLAGTVENTALMLKLADEYRRYGFDVRIHNYTVLLNYPDFQSPNTIEVKDEEDRWWIVSEGRGRPRGPPEAQREQADFRSSTWWNAYSMNGTVEGPIVYCNYGMKEDFERLEKWEVPLEGAIALIRYAGIPRADKIREAQKRGALGVVLFSDPLHYTGTDKNRTFPDDIYLPGQDAQRGSTLNTHGDPLTPGFPSLTYVHRSETVESAREKGYLPKIPVMPIGYHDAAYLFANMDGEVITDPQWKGGIPSPYKRTGNRQFRLHVRSRNVLRTITNVIATLPGAEEPDQWVLVGNHVDAWGTGAIDPLTGTATQLEMARVASKTFKIAPLRRSIVFCHWDAEEYGLIGSTEWLEEMQLVLGSRAVAYLNVDHIAGNVTLDVKAAPSLYRLIADAAEKVPHPNDLELEAGRVTLLDSWKHFRGRGPILGDRTIPEIGFPVGGSDYYRFISFAGIPSADFKLESSVGQSYALYHTMYETFWTVENLLDPYFTSMKAVGQLWMEVAHRLANELVLPLNPLHTIQMLTTMIQRVETQFMHSNVSRNFTYQNKMDRLKEAVRRLNYAARDLHLEAQEIVSGEALVSITRLFQINSRLQQLERSFLDNSAFNSPLHKHLLFGPSRHPSSQVPFLPVLLDPVVDFQQSLDATDLLPLHESFTRLQYAIESAILMLSF